MLYTSHIHTTHHAHDTYNIITYSTKHSTHTVHTTYYSTYTYIHLYVVIYAQTSHIVHTDRQYIHKKYTHCTHNLKVMTSGVLLRDRVLSVIDAEDHARLYLCNDCQQYCPH